METLVKNGLNFSIQYSQQPGTHLNTPQVTVNRFIKKLLSGAK